MGLLLGNEIYSPSKHFNQNFKAILKLSGAGNLYALAYCFHCYSLHDYKNRLSLQQNTFDINDKGNVRIYSTKYTKDSDIRSIFYMHAAVKLSEATFWIIFTEMLPLY